MKDIETKKKKKKVKEAESDEEGSSRKKKEKKEKKVKKEKKRKREEEEEEVEEKVEKQEMNEEASEIDQDNCTIYIEGLPYGSSEEEVKSLFSSAGEVTEVRLPRYQDSGRLRGYGHIDYKTGQEAAAAIVKLNGVTLGGRYLNVAPAVEKGTKAMSARSSIENRTRPTGCRTIFVKNLPYDINEDALRTAFLRFGKIEDVRIPIWNDTKRRKGIGYVQFATDYSTEQAFTSQSEISLRGRSLIVDYDSSQRPKGSFKNTQGVPWSKTKVGKRLTKHSRQDGTVDDA